MFTGIIEGLGSLQRVQPMGMGRRLTMLADFDLTDTRVGDSIAVNGVCLTAVSLNGRRFEADVSPETLQRSTFAAAMPGQRVNLERALQLSGRIDGHLVSGHIDGVATLSRRQTQGNAIVIGFSVSSALSDFMIEKGSVAVDGVSLTINACGPAFFEVAIIPHTATLTTVGLKQVGAAVNIETDMIGKYVARFVGRAKGAASSGIDMDVLRKNGFL